MGNVCGGASGQAVDQHGKPLNKTPAAAAPKTEAAKPVAEPAPAAAAAPAAATPAAAAPAAAAPAAAAAAPAAAAAGKKLKVYIIFYSTYGHIEKLAREYKTALESTGDVEAHLFRVAETLPADALEKMHAPPKPDDIPVMETSKLPDADAFVFGFPTRFGMMAGQMKNFFDTTGALWQAGALHGKPASMFTSTATQGGGQETTIMTAVTQLAHHGMIFVPTGYAAGAAMFGIQDAKGGSPWGAGTLAGPDGSRQPSEVELEALRVQAKHFGGIAKKLAA
ncbi:hypothetical protein CHLRE_10g456000v5 [Chlamydomonas reinhardtii]|uniref:NAD(P)H dehydrogenase (quinone) n=1 Tax=Chlamydomonas reinhardtii TaxID=3055 RepID=A8I0H0_CHLRE|nr:uncharacterized protein CHLRE_10g456000v5 [Chlamydomonas reinhardtii]PNW77892.1 hypothetical protein CHLRE_10g456000v5 [Chlamydomonas reinhardtii]|eukprot:XP_001698550.1 flagellar associated protein, quinone reductase-like protein [Chlamydomonas reinhardtii]